MCFSDDNLTFFQNSLKRWIFILSAFSLLSGAGNAMVVSTSIYYLPAILTALVNIIASVTVIYKGPQATDQGATLYKVLLATMIVTFIGTLVSIVLDLKLYTDLEAAYALAVQYCCADITFATCFPTQLPCGSESLVFVPLLDGIRNLITGSAMVAIFQVVVFYKSIRALKSLCVPVEGDEPDSSTSKPKTEV